MSWQHVIGLGVAGNFAGHLEQAGEAESFRGVAAAAPGAPKGIFPFYVPPGPGVDPASHFLHCMPISSTRLRLHSLAEPHQIEPEVALLCDIAYAPPQGAAARRRVVSLTVREAFAHDDCSIRRAGARKLSEKKNWGPESKGTARSAIAVDRFEPGGVLDRHRLASFLVRDGVVHDYGVDCLLTSYSYFHGRLIEWLVDRMNEQRDEGPLEDIARWLAVAGHPARALVAIGATPYTPFGERTFLAPGDLAVVAVYDPSRWDVAALRERAAADIRDGDAGLSWLAQEVVAPDAV